MMKICLFTENSYKGGLDTFLINLINAWPDPKADITLACNASHPGIKIIEDKTNQSLRVHRYKRFFSSSIALGHGKNWFSRTRLVRAFFVICFWILEYPILFPWYVFTLRRYFRQSDFNQLIVVNGGYPASLLCRSALIAWGIAGKNNKAALNYHNTAMLPAWYNSFFENIIDKLVLKHAASIVTVSQDCLNSLNHRAAFKNMSKGVVIYNGINDPLVNAAFRDNDTQSNYLLMLATYETRKGHAFLLHTFARVIKDFPELKLRIFGHGRLREIKRVEKLVQSLSLQKHVELNVFTSDTATLLANAKVLVVPSQEYESFGLTIIEAMAFSTPVVTTDVGGMTEVLAETDAGIICSKDSIEDFACALVSILKDPEYADSLGKNGRIAFENRYTADRMARQYWELLS